MKEYYLERLQWIFRYTSKNFFYCVAKTLCLIIGVPIYAVMFVVEMVLTFINMIFSVIPILNVVVGIICKSIIYITDKTFFICILTDIGKWRATHKKEIDYEVVDDEQDYVEATVEDDKPAEDSAAENTEDNTDTNA